MEVLSSSSSVPGAAPYQSDVAACGIMGLPRKNPDNAPYAYQKPHADDVLQSQQPFHNGILEHEQWAQRAYEIFATLTAWETVMAVPEADRQAKFEQMVREHKENSACHSAKEVHVFDRSNDISYRVPAVRAAACL